MKLNVSDRLPVIRQTVSSRLIGVGVLIFLVLAGAVIFGFYRRIRNQRAHTEQQRLQTVAADSATSNRSQLEGPSALSGLPVTPPVTPGSSPSTSKPVGPPPSLRPLYAKGTSVSHEDLDAQARALAMGRRLEREQEALDAPTGSSDQHSASNTTALSMNPGQVNGLVRPVSETSPLPLGATLGGAPSLEGIGSGQGYRAQNGQEEKRRFAEGGEGGEDDYLNTTRTAPLSRWVIQRGTVIPASLPSKLVSDLPGDLIAEVVRDVYDSPTQSYVEIPAGSRLVGEYNSSVSYGQNRVQIAWTAIYFPDGSFIDLDRMPSHAADGAVGLKDQTDNHLKRLLGGVALSSLLAAGVQVSQNRSVLAYPTTGQEIQSAVGTQAAQAGQQITNRNLNIQPTLKIRPGDIFAVSVKKDIVFAGPYQPIEVK